MRQLHQFALVGLGGAFGALARLGMGSFGDPGTIGTFVANICGCAALGLLAHSPRADQLRWFAATGFCGGLTTMSTFALELVTGVSVASVWTVALYAALSIGAGLSAFTVARSLGPKHPVAGAVLGFTGLAALTGLTAGIIELPGRGLSIAFGFVLAAAVGAGVRGLLSSMEKFNARLVAVGLINIVGAFFLAAVSGFPDPDLFPGGRGGGLLTSGGVSPSDAGLVIGIGAVGAFTTFSTAISQLECIARENSRAMSVFVGTAMFIAIIAAAALGRSV